MIYLVDSECLLKHNIRNFIFLNDREFKIRSKLTNHEVLVTMHTALFDSMDRLKRLFDRFPLVYVYADEIRYQRTEYNVGYQCTWKAVHDDHDNLQYMWKQFTSG